MDSLTNDSDFASNSDGAYTKALLRALTFAKVKFIRYSGVDLYNSLRCKAVPVDRFKKSAVPSLDYKVAFAEVVFGGLPSFGDALDPSSGLDASGSLVLRPDLSTLRVLPYAPSSAIVLGYVFDQQTDRVSEFCCRGLLKRLIDSVAEKHQLAFNVGAELEFCLVDAKTNEPVDLSNFADSVLLNRKEKLVSDIYDQLNQQDIEVELIHAESAPGQLEIVLAYQKDPVSLADNVVLARETIKSLAHSNGLKALFLPKHDRDKAGNGCHFHVSIRDTTTDENLFHVDSSISEVGKSFMEGILRHLPALLAVTLPSVNSFRRIGAGCWTGHQTSWAFDDKESSLRVVPNLQEKTWDHVEFKLCDSHANLYLALACVLWCGVDGIVQKLPLRPPYHEQEDPESLPQSPTESLELFEKDDLLMKLVPKRLVQAYVATRRVEQLRASKMSHMDELQEALDRA